MQKLLLKQCVIEDHQDFFQIAKRKKELTSAMLAGLGYVYDNASIHWHNMIRPKLTIMKKEARDITTCMTTSYTRPQYPSSYQELFQVVHAPPIPCRILRTDL